MKILTVVGARPQFIKASVVTQALRRAGVHEVLAHTGQHYDQGMSDVFFQELAIPPPDIHLGIGSDRHGAQTGKMLAALEEVMLRERPDRVLVYGDTNSTLAAALAAAKLHIPVAHIEAGLRSFNQRMPEEINRVLTDHVSRWLFVPTTAAVANLAREGISGARVQQSGDVMYDVALHYAREAERRSDILARLGLKPGQYLLATVHRAENTDDRSRLSAIFEGLLSVAADLPVVLPLHPRTRKVLEQNRSEAHMGGALKMLDPVGYLDMLMLEKNARLIVTDSGGVQKEAFFYHVPCVTLRDETEWVELVEARWNRLAPPTSAAEVVRVIRQSLAAEPGAAVKPYGDGRAAERIVPVLIQ
ncbi:MAG: non-hydrolyzing UDP-N-acetylglucosamine 2-epimerase [Nevskiales bacterium]